MCESYEQFPLAATRWADMGRRALRVPNFGECLVRSGSLGYEIDTWKGN